MGQTVYVDLLFMINFSMDFLCFFLAAKLFGIKLAIGRALLASAIGGAYSVTALFISVTKITAFAIDVGMCALMCAICFGGRRKTERSHNNEQKEKTNVCKCYRDSSCICHDNPVARLCTVRVL